jgi:hypothetical protein
MQPFNDSLPVMFASSFNYILCTLFVSVIWVSRNCTLYRGSFALNILNPLHRVPPAIVHVGPYKTSSSHIQVFPATHSSVLESENIFWPRERSGEVFTAKFTALLPPALRDPTNDHDGIIAS